MNIPVTLSDGKTIQVAATAISSSTEQDVSFGIESMDIQPFFDSIKAFAAKLPATFSAISPNEVEVEFAAAIAYEAGKLTALIVNGKTDASFKITLKWKTP